MSVDHYENFPVASILLPARLRPAVIAIYRFARAADDIADEGDAPDRERLAALARFRQELRAIETRLGAAPQAGRSGPLEVGDGAAAWPFRAQENAGEPRVDPPADAGLRPTVDTAPAAGARPAANAPLHADGASHATAESSTGTDTISAIFAPLADAIDRHALPMPPFHRLLDAFEQDVTVKRYADFAALKRYCSRSADPVGELMLHLYDAATDENLALSDAICTGLQLVNFWQDVAIDRDKGRIYLPRDEMIRFGVTEDDIAAGRCNAAWRRLLAFETARARSLLHFGAPLARRLPGRVGWELRLVVQGGLRILQRIEHAGFDVFRARPTLGRRDAALLAWRALRMPRGYPASPYHP
ncbi:hypothetical protein GCM10023144_29540 [Pigmentiphaga soli]|uniref:Squalene synthase HpnC n=1 Tax=Pigmentiphaga soli TaxID=1007095 RepID=A0ABP8H8G0_9BURK